MRPKVAAAAILLAALLATSFASSGGHRPHETSSPRKLMQMDEQATALPVADEIVEPEIIATAADGEFHEKSQAEVPQTKKHGSPPADEVVSAAETPEPPMMDSDIAATVTSEPEEDIVAEAAASPEGVMLGTAEAAKLPPARVIHVPATSAGLKVAVGTTASSYC
jgi:hypothetical protein